MSSANKDANAALYRATRAGVMASRANLAVARATCQLAAAAHR